MIGARGRAVFAGALVSVVLSAAGCRSDLDTLRRWMTGSFASTQQHLADPEHYHDIRLHMVPIWTERPAGPWLYVEQAAAHSVERPYRQRVYQLRANGDGTLASVVYELPGEPLRFAGAWQAPERLDALAPDDLLLREGCSITLRRAPGMFVGATSGKGCSSSLAGAAYTTSEVEIWPDRLISWDRGFDENDEQVWGAAQGGYVFIKTDAAGGTRR